ncbi:Uncharacterised protein [Vibrio cholerae]|nr:Uncharacterised protein [Vibrio cholerae]
MIQRVLYGKILQRHREKASYLPPLQTVKSRRQKHRDPLSQQYVNS